MTRTRKFSPYGCLILICVMPWLASAQESNTTFRIFGHVDATIEQEFGEQNSDFALGEHDLFVQSKITPRISVLSETIVGPTGTSGHGAADYKVSIERARVKFQHREWLSLIVGKMHTPVNYWNDVYHHGRLFFPTIDRPRSFGTTIPIHTLGLRLQGQNIGALNFGYDLVIGNGLSSTDVSDGTLQKSMTAAIHIRPRERMRIGMSAYRDLIGDNMVGSHAGHGTFHYMMGAPNWYPVDLDFELYCFSFHNMSDKWETLLETTWNRTGLSDSNFPDPEGWLDSLNTLGTANNFTLFLFAGRAINERDMIYGLVDLTDFEERDLHIRSNRLAKFGLGWRRDFSALVNIKFQVERYTGWEGYEVPKDDKWELKFRVAYCLN